MDSIDITLKDKLNNTCQIQARTIPGEPNNRAHEAEMVEIIVHSFNDTAPNKYVFPVEAAEAVVKIWLEIRNEIGFVSVSPKT